MGCGLNFPDSMSLLFSESSFIALFPESPPLSIQIEEKGEGASVWANIHIRHAFLTGSLSPCWGLLWCIFVALNIFHRWDVWVTNSMDSCISAIIFCLEKYKKYLRGFASLFWMLGRWYSILLACSVSEEKSDVLFFFFISNMFFLSRSF